MRILVTGGAGFIGSHVVDAMVRLGHQVAILDNLSTGNLRNVNAMSTFYHADITDAELTARVLGEFRPEVVIHHAAQVDVRVSTTRPAFDAQTNIVGAINLLTSAVSTGVRKIIYASSGGAVYGNPEYLPVTELHPVRPVSPYGISKHTVEQYLYQYEQNHGLTYTVLRYPNVYGPRQNPHGEAGVIAIFGYSLLADSPCTIYGDGEAERDYLYVADVVEANVLALDRGNGKIINLGSGIGTSVNQVYTALASAVGTNRLPVYAPGRIGEVNKIYLDASFARETLGWEPRVDLAEGIRLTLAWLKENAGPAA